MAKTISDSRRCVFDASRIYRAWAPGSSYEYANVGLGVVGFLVDSPARHGQLAMVSVCGTELHRCIRSASRPVSVPSLDGRCQVGEVHHVLDTRELLARVLPKAATSPNSD